MNKPFFAVLIFLSLALHGCKSSDAIIDSNTKERVVGYKNATYLIGKAKKSQIHQQVSQDYGNDLTFAYDKKGVLSGVYVSGASFESSNGFRVGAEVAAIQPTLMHFKPDSMAITASGVDIGYLPAASNKHWKVVHDTKNVWTFYFGKISGRKVGN